MKKAACYPGAAFAASEGDPQSELNVARAKSGGGSTELRAREVHRRLPEVHTVEQVEELSSEIELAFLADHPEWEAFDDVKVRVRVSGAEIGVSSEIARLARRGFTEIARLEDSGQELGPFEP